MSDRAKTRHYAVTATVQTEADTARALASGWNGEEVGGGEWELTAVIEADTPRDAARDAHQQLQNHTGVEVRYIHTEELRAEIPHIDRGDNLDEVGPITVPMRNVYDDEDDPNVIEVTLRVGHDGGIIVDDHPEIDGGTWNIVIENRRGDAYLMVWQETDFGNDPRHTIKLTPDH